MASRHSLYLSCFLLSTKGVKTARSNCLYFSLFDTVPRKKIFDFEKLRWAPWIFREPKNWYRWFPMIPGHRTEKLLSIGFEVLALDLAWFTMNFTFYVYKNLSPFSSSLSWMPHFLLIIFILSSQNRPLAGMPPSLQVHVTNNRSSCI